MMHSAKTKRSTSDADYRKVGTNGLRVLNLLAEGKNNIKEAGIRRYRKEFKNSMIRRCSDADVPTIETIINQAAFAYKGSIPPDCWHEPYMSRAELLAEIAAGVQFWGWEDSGSLAGVMGIQQVLDATLIRHAYVQPVYQSRGIGGALLKMLANESNGQLLVGTWTAAEWAIRFYERHGFRLLPTEEKDRLIARYWRISERQRETSVVLEKPAVSTPQSAIS